MLVGCPDALASAVLQYVCQILCRGRCIHGNGYAPVLPDGEEGLYPSFPVLRENDGLFVCSLGSVCGEVVNMLKHGPVTYFALRRDYGCLLEILYHRSPIPCYILRQTEQIYSIFANLPREGMKKVPVGHQKALPGRNFVLKLYILCLFC